jgi:hypothetical protein
MRTITKQFKVYTIDELSKEAQNKAIEKWQNNEDFPFLYEAMEQQLYDLLNKYKIKIKKTDGKSNARCLYSLNHNQGDGAMFEGTFYWEGRYVNINHEGHYYHYNSKHIKISTETGLNAKQSVYDRFEEIYQTICKELEDWGHSVIKTALDPETIKNTMRINNYEFLEDGSMF